VRPTLTLLALFASAALLPAADPKPDATKAGDQYFTALQKSAELMTKVKDEATATEAKAKLDNWHDEAREARRQFFKALAEVDGRDGELAESMGVVWKNVKQVNDTITNEFDRIGTNQKAAYKVLRDTKLFAELEKEYEGKAASRANNLMTYAKTHSTRNDGKAPKLEDLAKYADEGQKALTDPWGFPYQMVTKPGKEGYTRTFVWTVSPYTGKKLGTPPPDEK
jgi:hypothetical protein